MILQLKHLLIIYLIFTDFKNWGAQSRCLFADFWLFFVCKVFYYSTLKTELQPSDNFDTESFSLTFNSKLNYSTRTEFSISNTMIILEFIEYITDRINKKVEELEAEIIK